jgi:hypothetical protein
VNEEAIALAGLQIIIIIIIVLLYPLLKNAEY